MGDEQTQLQEEKLSEQSDNLVDSIDRVMKLVSKYIVSSLVEYREREEELRLSVILDKLKALFWNRSEKKTVFCLAHLSISYPNELKRLCGNTVQAYSGALESLMRKEIVEEVEECQITDLKRKYLLGTFKTMPKNKAEEITFFALTPAAKELFKDEKFEEDLRKEVGELINGKAIKEKARFGLVLKQNLKNHVKQEEIKQREKDEQAERNMLSVEIDKLILKHKDNYLNVLEEIHKLLPRFPNQKGHLIKKIKQLREIGEGKRENIDWNTVIKQTERNLTPDTMKRPQIG